MAKIIRIRCGTVNCYLIKEGDAAILVDTANAGREGNIERALFANGVPPKSLRMIFLTHGHFDHTGCADYFRSYYNVPVAMHPADVSARPLTGRGVLGTALNAFTKPGLAAHKPPRADIDLGSLENLEAYGIRAKVLPLPGHTRGSVGLLLPEGQLIAGDMYMSYGRPGLAYLAEDFEKLRKTHEGLKGLEVAAVYHGHGRPFAGSQLLEF